MDRLSKISGLYVLTDPNLRPDRTPEEIAEAALAGGARIIQLRDKETPREDLIRLARRICAMAHRVGALFIVNDKVDIALASGADGVHLGPEDMAPAQARTILGPGRLIGVSVSTLEEALPLADYASYFAIGAIYGSSTKSDAGPPIGTKPIQLISARYPGVPIVGIGSINKDNIAPIKRAGADSAAVVSAVICAPDMEQATRELVQAWEAG
jgi:thiamine-phosphate diphosphorylase